MTKTATIYGMKTDAELLEMGIEAKEVLSTCSHCYEQYYVELLFNVGFVLDEDAEWTGICGKCHKKLCD